LRLESEADTERLGAALAGSLPDGAVVALIGTLGAGKTRLVQAVAAATGIDRREVTSPTFVLLQEYHGRRNIYHFDAYRLGDEAEFVDLGAEEYFAGSGLCFVEWADRLPAAMPAERLEIELQVVGETARTARITAHGKAFEQALETLSAIRKQPARGE